VQGQICDILRPQLAMNCFLLLWPHRFSHFGCINLGGGGVGGGALILDRCRAFDLFASVDAHLWFSPSPTAYIVCVYYIRRVFDFPAQRKEVGGF
jgi:hypothetical protein